MPREYRNVSLLTSLVVEEHWCFAASTCGIISSSRCKGFASQRSVTYLRRSNGDKTATLRHAWPQIGLGLGRSFEFEPNPDCTALSTPRVVKPWLLRYETYRGSRYHQTNLAEILITARTLGPLTTTQRCCNSSLRIFPVLLCYTSLSTISNLREATDAVTKEGHTS